MKPDSEADFTGGIRRPVNFESFLGNTRVVEVLRRAVHRERLPHAMIFAGPEGVGKRTLALLLAQSLNCSVPESERPCGKCVSCTKIASNLHPDIREIRPDGAYIKIEQIRQLIGEIAYQPFEARYRVIVLDGADQMRQEAANSLLKTLEEPPSRSIIILITTNPYLLLGTIRSRSRMLLFGGVPEDQIESYLVEVEHRSPHEAQLAAVYGNGSIGAALSFDLAQHRQVLAQALRFVSLLLRRGSFAEASPLAALVSQNKEAFPEWIDAVSALLRDIYFARVAPGRVSQKEVQEEIQALAASTEPSSVVTAIDAVRRLRYAVQHNANRQIALEALFIESVIR